MMTATSQRVPANTADQVNQALIDDMAHRIIFYQAHPELIDQRLQELDQEWDVERMIETEAPLVTLTGICMAVNLNRKWILISLLAQGMMLTHALQGFYPMLPLFRRMGFRTQQEIAVERYALKSLRGDFEPVSTESSNSAQRADAAFSVVRIPRIEPAANQPA